MAALNKHGGVVGFAGFAVTVAAVEISRKKKKSATIK